MEVARVATMRGHKVTIYEKSNDLGGVFVSASAPSFKEKDKQLIAWYKRQMKQLKIDIKFNTEITDLSQIDANEIVVATGSTARKLKMEGAERCIDAIDYLNGKEVGDNVVIIGGGLSGCEIAYDLILKGKKPSIVEVRDDLMVGPGLCLANSSFLRDYFKYKKTPIYLESKLTRIMPKSVEIIGKDNKTTTLKADDVITCIGYNPAPLSSNGKKVHIVGDAYKVGNLRTVIWRAWDIATKL